MGRHKSHLTAGQRERLSLELRLNLFGGSIPKIKFFLINEKGKNLRLEEIRKIQKVAILLLGLRTDRSSWRSLNGAYLWFAENWIDLQLLIPFYKIVNEYDDILAKYDKSPRKIRSMHPLSFEEAVETAQIEAFIEKSTIGNIGTFVNVIPTLPFNTLDNNQPEQKP